MTAVFDVGGFPWTVALLGGTRASGPPIAASGVKWIADGMQRPKRLKMAKPAALAMAEASLIPLGE